VRRIIALCVLLLGLGACAPTVESPGPVVTSPSLGSDAVVTPDGALLPLHAWLPEGKPRAVILALHGFNDYGNFFAAPGTWFAAQGIAAYAYDQRGFGAAPNPGLWPGSAALTADLTTAARLLAARYPGVPLYLLGDSMGGAVVMTAVTGNDPPPSEGVILTSPAVWARSTMPGYQRGALWLGAHTVPWMTVTGRGLNRQPSDNIPMLRALGRDPLVIKETRIDALWGLTNLMDAALAAAPKLPEPALILYGGNDQIIPEEPTDRMIASLPDDNAASIASRRRVIRYPGAYHMLLRDLDGEAVWRDILAWIDNAGRLPPTLAQSGSAAVAQSGGAAVAESGSVAETAAPHP
jgi:alpha-beta hydrolase superfamily lysophospholipase